MRPASDSYRYSRHIITGLLLGALVLIATYAALRNWLEQPLAITSTQTVEFNSGSSIYALAKQLQQAGLLQHPRLFRLWTRTQHIDTKLKAGEYEINPGDTLAKLLDKMLRGEVKQYSITIVEGWNFKQMMQAIAAHPQILHTLGDTNSQQLMQQLGLTSDDKPLHAEGQFLPDTYYINKNTKDSDLLKRAHRAMQQVLQQLWSQRRPDLPIKTTYEALILASIIEKESAVADERPIIAGVFINRLRKNMRLQTDPTVIYGIGDKYDGDIRFRDLRRDTPYNTYTRKGLPPTPIAMPGRAAIAAAVQPADTDYLYFVATSDRSGRHIFSSTLAQHEKQVDIHQRGK
jgi:UPF0755 protein